LLHHSDLLQMDKMQVIVFKDLLSPSGLEIGGKNVGIR